MLSGCLIPGWAGAQPRLMPTGLTPSQRADITLELHHHHLTTTTPPDAPVHAPCVGGLVDHSCLSPSWRAWVPAEAQAGVVHDLPPAGHSSGKGHTQACLGFPIPPWSSSSACTLSSLGSFCLCSQGLCLARGRLGSLLSPSSVGRGPGREWVGKGTTIGKKSQAAGVEEEFIHADGEDTRGSGGLAQRCLPWLVQQRWWHVVRSCSGEKGQSWAVGLSDCPGGERAAEDSCPLPPGWSRQVWHGGSC